MNVDELIEVVYSVQSVDGAFDHVARRCCMSRLMEQTFAWLQEGNLDALIEFYQKLDPEKMHPVMIMGALRAVFGHKTQILPWRSFYERGIVVAERQLDPEKFQSLFMGLIDVTWADRSTGTESAFDELIGIHPTLVRR